MTEENSYRGFIKACFWIGRGQGKSEKAKTVLSNYKRMPASIGHGGRRTSGSG